MGPWGRGAILTWACCALLACASFSAQDPPVRVALSCKVVSDPDIPTHGQFLVEIKDAAGTTICEAFADVHRPAKFTRVRPGLFVACIVNRSGGQRCQSVDLYPPPGALVASFFVELRPPLPAVPAESLDLIDRVHVVIPEKARREFGAYMKDLKNGKTAEAARHLERSLAIHPEYAEALSNLGCAHHMAGDYGRATQLFERVTEIAPAMYVGWLNLSVTLLVAGNPRRALQAQMRALRLHPDDPFVMYQIGLCHYTLGEFDEAKRFFQRVIELDPCSATYPHLPLARIALAENRSDEAARFLREVSRLHPYAPQPPGMKELVSQLTGVRQP